MSQFEIMGAARRNGLQGLGGLSGMGGIVDDLDNALSQAGTQEGEIRGQLSAAADTARRNAGEVGETVERVGGQLLELNGVVQSTPGKDEKTRVANAVLLTMAAVVSAAGSAYGGVMVAAVQALWRLIDPAVRALSDSLARITTGDALMNQMLNTIGYSRGAAVGGRDQSLAKDALTEAFRDGWFITRAADKTDRFPFGASTFCNLAMNFASINGVSACTPVMVNRVASASWAVVREAAKSVDSLYEDGRVSEARELWGKIVRILDSTFTNGRSRVESVTGIPAGAIVGLSRYPFGTSGTGLRPATRWPGYTGGGIVLNPGAPRSKEEAAYSDKNLVLLGGAYANETFGMSPGRWDMIAFKPSRLPRDVFRAVTDSMFVSEDDVPCDYWIRFLTGAAMGNYDDSTGWPYSVWGAKLLEMRAEQDKASKSGGPSKKKSGASSWSTTKKVAVAGAVAGGGTGLYFLGRALRWWK